MRRLFALVVAMAAGPAAAQAPFTYQTPKWWYSSGDFNGDGQHDLVLLDRATGSILLGLQIGAAGFGWMPPEASGFAAPSALCVGHFDNTACDQIAVTAPAENRVSVFSVNIPSLTLGIRHVDPGGPAPSCIVPLDADGGGATDLFISGDSGGSGDHFYREVLAGLDAGQASLWHHPTAHATYHAWPLVRKQGTSAALAAYQEADFTVQGVGTADLTDSSPVDGVVATPDSLMAYGVFDGGTLAQVLLYQPGDATVLAAKVTEPAPGSFAWGPSATLNFPRAVQLIVTVPTATGARLGVIFADASAAVFDFDGTTLTLRAELTGSGFDLLAAVGNDAVLTARGGRWETWDSSASNGPLHPVASGDLPLPSSASRVSNIVFATAEPFVDPAAQPVFFGHVRDWTTAATGAGSQWSVTALSQGTAGLDNPLTADYQPSPGAARALVNQYRPDVSIRTMNPAAGPDPGDVIISPQAGIYPPLRPAIPGRGSAAGDPGDKFLVTFTTTRSHGFVFYRLAGGSAWQNYNPAAPPALTADATVEAFALHGNSRTPTRKATYAFANSAALAVAGNLDANANGLPDQWEKAFNITDPNGDADGDGSSNLTEFTNGTDPRDPTSGAAAAPVLGWHIVDQGGGKALRLEWAPATSSAILEASDNLRDWAPVTTGIGSDATSRFYEVPLTPPAKPCNFYRLRQP